MPDGVGGDEDRAGRRGGVVAAANLAVVGHVGAQGEAEVGTRQQLGRPHLARAILGQVEDLQVVHLQAVAGAAVAMPVVRRQGADAAVVAHQDRQGEVAAEQRADGAGHGRIEDDVVDEPVLQ